MTAPVKREPVDELLGCTGLLISIPFTSAIASVVHGYVLFKLWGWFAHPLLNAPALSFAGAAGLALLARYIVFTGSPSSKDDDGALDTLKKLPVRIIGSLLCAGVTLGTAYFIKGVWL